MELTEEIFEKYNFEDVYIDYESIRNICIHPKLIVKLITKNNFGKRNRCIECNCDLGKFNPRQLCGKYYCDSSQK